MTMILLIQKPVTYNSLGSVRIVAVDCGIKNNQIRCLANRGACVKVVPWDYDFNVEGYVLLIGGHVPGVWYSVIHMFDTYVQLIMWSWKN